METWVFDACLITLVVVAACAAVVALRDADELRANRAYQIVRITVNTVGSVIGGTDVLTLLVHLYEQGVLNESAERLARAMLALLPWLGLF